MTRNPRTDPLPGDALTRSYAVAWRVVQVLEAGHRKTVKIHSPDAHPRNRTLSMEQFRRMFKDGLVVEIAKEEKQIG
jgi:hypothetical protein